MWNLIINWWWMNTKSRISNTKPDVRWMYMYIHSIRVENQLNGAFECKCVSCAVKQYRIVQWKIENESMQRNSVWCGSFVRMDWIKLFIILSICYQQVSKWQPIASISTEKKIRPLNEMWHLVRMPNLFAVSQ